MFRHHIRIRKCNVRHLCNDIVARLPTAFVHAIDHLLHEHTQPARLLAFSLSTALPADVHRNRALAPIRLGRGHSLGLLANPVRIALKPFQRLFRFQLVR